MKRCPQCEFIYEDDQSLCDMDGVLLVLDDRHLPNLHALAPVPARPKVQPKRNRAVPAFATLVLALVLGMVYYVSVHRRAAQTAYTPAPAAAAAATPEPAPVVNPTPEPQPSQEAPAMPAKQPETRPAKKQPVKTAPAPAVTQPKAEPKKEESKVGSILKKTGRILKKPFKF